LACSIFKRLLASFNRSLSRLGLNTICYCSNEVRCGCASAGLESKPGHHHLRHLKAIEKKVTRFATISSQPHNSTRSLSILISWLPTYNHQQHHCNGRYRSWGASLCKRRRRSRSRMSW
jgi:hypothetical protein